MAAMESATVPVTDSDGVVVGAIEISLLPGGTVETSTAPLLAQSTNMTLDFLEPGVRLLESCEYRYQFVLKGVEVMQLSTDRPEVLQADTREGYTGRIRPGSYVGLLPVTVLAGERKLGGFSLEVRSRKLNYLGQYQWMLRDLADAMSEIIMSRFAPTEQRFSIEDSKDAVTLYQRFAFLRSLIGSPDFKAAISQILRRPHVSWREVNQIVYPGQGLRATSSVARQMSQPGPRALWSKGILPTIPATLERRQTEVSLDTAPNRFVKFALTRWRGVVSQIGDILQRYRGEAFAERGIRETREIIDELDAILSEELFRELGPLLRFPADDQVLQKREGYRDVLRAYIQFEVASKLAWAGGENIYGAGQRDVATLYEYWVFLKLGELISSLCDTPFEFSKLIEIQDDGLNLTLQKGRSRVLQGRAHRLGRSLDIELWFNRTFSYSPLLYLDSSWSRGMRPDYSLKISPSPGEPASFEPVFLHFDAKYRLEILDEVLGSVPSGVESNKADAEESVEQVSTTLRSDLLKMHAYRDAIRRSAGAYVIYPGTDNSVCYQYHELLPGLGAFALRPTETGFAAGTDAIKVFIEDVLEHIASQITQHERSRFWLQKVFSETQLSKKAVTVANFLVAPPADTQVLLGYVKSSAHWDWILATRRYNLRADERRGSVGLAANELSCDILILSCLELNKTALARVVGYPELRSQEEMRRLDYPDPRGRLYYCLEVELIAEEPWQSVITTEEVEKLRASKTPVVGAPVAVSWLELVTKLRQ